MWSNAYTWHVKVHRIHNHCMKGDIIYFFVYKGSFWRLAAEWWITKGSKLPSFNSPMRLHYIFLMRKSGKCTLWIQQDKVWWKTHRWNNLWFWSNAHFSQWKHSHCLQIALNWGFKECVWQIMLDSRKLWPWHIYTLLLWPIKFSQVQDNIWFRWENSGYSSREIV